MRQLSPSLNFGIGAPLVTIVNVMWLFSACGGGRTLDEQAQANLRRVAQFYQQYVASHDGTEPQSAEELRQWVAGSDPAKLAISSDTDLDAVFVSLRDGQPYIVVPAGKGGVTQQGDRIIAHEQTGSGGKRMVAFDIGRVTEMDEMLFVHLQEEHL
jgi:hypothetical protein